MFLTFPGPFLLILNSSGLSTVDIVTTVSSLTVHLDFIHLIVLVVRSRRHSLPSILLPLRAPQLQHSTQLAATISYSTVAPTASCILRSSWQLAADRTQLAGPDLIDLKLEFLKSNNTGIKWNKK